MSGPLLCGRMAVASAAPRALHSEERSGVVAWLDDGLRGGRRGRLEAEYPESLVPSSAGAQQVIFEAGRPVAHAMFHVCELRAAERRLRLGLIGLVYTEPAARGRGLASVCVEACVRELERRHVPLAALWSDRHAFYERLGFVPAGRENHLRLDVETCRRARNSCDGEGSARKLSVGSPCPGDWTDLEGLYARKPVHTARAPGALQRLAAAPDTRLVAARHRGRVVAWAALGRGDDFKGVVHEWAGAPAAILACLETLCREEGEIGWLCGPVDESPAGLLRAAGAPVHPGCFALVRLLDPAGAWRATGAATCGEEPLRLVASGAGAALQSGARTLALTPGTALSLLYGPGIPPTVEAFLTREQRRALRCALPFPLYLWGFDSI